MTDQIVITEKTSQAKDVRAAIGSRYGMVLPAEGHLFDLLEPEDVVPEWKRWCRFLGRHARRLGDAEHCLASEKRSSGKSRGWAWWIVCCYGDLSGVRALILLVHTRFWKFLRANRASDLRSFGRFTVCPLASRGCCVAVA